MEKQYLGMPVTIHLADVANSIDLVDLATQVFNPLMRDVHEKLTRHGMKFCLPLYLQHQFDVRRVDFRYALLDGLLPDSLTDERFWGHIRRALNSVLQRNMSMVESRLSTMTVAERVLAQQALADRREAVKAEGEAYPLSEFQMSAFVREALPDRIWQWLDDETACGRLTVKNIHGRESVPVDDLVRWAAGQKLVVEQDALPGCESIVAGSYKRLHQQLSEGKLSAPLSPLTLPSPISELSDVGGPIPGAIPRTENGKLAIELAWKIESTLKRRATAKEVMAGLMEMATKGERPEILQARGSDGRSVKWVTSKGDERTYSIDSLRKTLQAWHESRQAGEKHQPKKHR